MVCESDERNFVDGLWVESGIFLWLVFCSSVKLVGHSSYTYISCTEKKKNSCRQTWRTKKWPPKRHIIYTCRGFLASSSSTFFSANVSNVMAIGGLWEELDFVCINHRQKKNQKRLKRDVAHLGSSQHCTMCRCPYPHPRDVHRGIRVFFPQPSSCVKTFLFVLKSDECESSRVIWKKVPSKISIDIN